MLGFSRVLIDIKVGDVTEDRAETVEKETQGEDAKGNDTRTTKPR
jgi:hypothetical protein